MLQTPIPSDLKVDVLDAVPMIIAIHDTDHNIIFIDGGRF